MTLSRDSGENAGASEPVLTDAVLLVEDGRLDPKPLLASTASGSFSLGVLPTGRRPFLRVCGRG